MKLCRRQGGAFKGGGFGLVGGVLNAIRVLFFLPNNRRHNT